MSTELKRILADASKLYDEDSGTRPDEVWTYEAANTLLELICELRSTSPVADVVMIPGSWFAAGVVA